MAIGSFAAVNLAMLTLPLRADERRADVQGHLERIECYRMALSEQRQALDATDEQIEKALAAYEAAVAGDDSAAAAARIGECSRLGALSRFYTNRVLRTMRTLAGEHEGLAGKLQSQRLDGQAVEHISHAAALWEEKAELYGDQADDACRRGDFDAAAPLYEKAYACCNSAQSRWRQVLALLKLTNRKAVDRLNHSVSRGLKLLRAAVDAYYDSYQLHREKARGGTVDIHKRNAGEEWGRAAQAQKNHERVTQALRQAERPH